MLTICILLRDIDRETQRRNFYSIHTFSVPSILYAYEVYGLRHTHKKHFFEQEIINLVHRLIWDFQHLVGFKCEDSQDKYIHIHKEIDSIIIFRDKKRGRWRNFTLFTLHIQVFLLYTLVKCMEPSHWTQYKSLN